MSKAPWPEREPVPYPEVSERPRCRRATAQRKLAVLREFDACGALGAHRLPPPRERPPRRYEHAPVHTHIQVIHDVTLDSERWHVGVPWRTGEI